MATSSWRLEDLQQLEELGLAGQLESTRLQEEDVGVDATPAAGAGHSLEQPEPDLYAMGEVLSDLLMAETGPSFNIPQQMLVETVLMASTSHVVKHGSQGVTYINRGQWYEIHMKPCVPSALKNGAFYKCVLSVGFSELRMRNNESELLERWGKEHPCERLLDIDRRGCEGVCDVNEDENLNSLSLLWQPLQPATISVKVNCLSSEFAAKKHGGEKGILLQLCMTLYCGDECLQRSGCNVKVFKDKGGDRKQKQDQQKIEKLSPSERSQYQLSQEVSLFLLFPSVTTQLPLTPSTLTQQSSPALNSQSYSSPLTDLTTLTDLTDLTTLTDLSVLSSVEEARHWLSSHNFSSYLSLFASYSGADLLRLSRRDLVELCGAADGIRLYNALRSRTLRTVYVCIEDQTVYHALCLEQLTAHELLEKLSDKVSLKPCAVSCVVMLTSSGIPVMVDDMVVRNLADEDSFIVSAVKDETGSLRLLLRSHAHNCLLTHATPINLSGSTPRKQLQDTSFEQSPSS